ncbi:M56 family metallopeptidase [Mucilaginibacter aquaedulcis]|uniref:M56 family metallopeptidase n=1 Tax=Mucilaginibacter aquaedulcis TaxID=1187081 RepID=UPI0025B2E268|nr:M56 family metallopeptidase [Mucilaginibacter aquaedulcis]MDN3547133.1 M56 family metallopeptidase [Mucilaginibacter aquaedulcis]
MPVLFVFLLKVNIALLLFCTGYYLVLRHLTFYTLNRVYLLAAILFASVYPEINLLPFLQDHEELAKPMQQVAINWQAQNLADSLNHHDYWRWAEVVFWMGVYVLAIRLAVQLFSLYQLYKNSKPDVINNHPVRVTDKDMAPFSFWQSIFVNPAKHEPADLKAILLHEQVHVNEWHTADILLAELSSIFYWFNPGIWLIKKAIKENVEFITDRKILSKGVDSKAYQYSLLSVGFNYTGHSIVNHFNLSTIKKRIVMMNTKRSSRINLTRYAFMVPVLIALLLVFSISKADFAKPIRTKLIYTAPALAKIMSVNEGEKFSTKPIVAKAKMTNKKVAAALPQVQKADTVKKTPDNKDHEYKITTDDSVRVVIVEPKVAVSSKVAINPKVATTVITKATTSSTAIAQVNVQPNVNVNHAIYRIKVDPKVVVDTAKGKVTRVSTSKIVMVTSDGTNSKTIGVNKNKGVDIITSNGAKPLILVDDKETSEADMKKIDPATIESMNVIKTNDDSMVKKYGEKAKDGVILITTKKSKN